MSNGGRYGAGLPKIPAQSSDAALAAIQTELKNQSSQITIISKKLDQVTTAVTAMNNQMGHLVTKESCSEGRRLLSDDLKQRMDGDRDITGTDLKVPALWQNAIAAQVAADSGKPDIEPPKTTEHQKPRGFAFWISIVAAFVTISGGIFGVTFAAYKVLDVIDSTSTMLERLDQVQSQPPPTKQPR